MAIGDVIFLLLLGVSVWAKFFEPYITFIAAWFVVLAALFCIAIAVNVVTHAIDDPGA